jgi:zinc transport system substrate-binding protein
MTKMRWLASLFAAAALASFSAAGSQAHPLRIGVTLNPYYSWVANVGGSAVTVVPVVPSGADPHSYQPRPEDLAALTSLDAVVMNGLGHDAFLEPMLEAAGKSDLRRLDLNRGVPLLPGASSGANSHSFLSVLAASQQVQTLAKELASLDPQDARLFEENARAYTKRLRHLLAEALARLEGLDLSAVRIATVHDGYAYLFSDLGLTVRAVVQPRHGLEPSARQLADTIERIRAARVNVLFTEMALDHRTVEAIERETGCRLFRLTHMAGGDDTADRFERDTKANLEAIVAGVTAAAGRR